MSDLNTRYNIDFKSIAKGVYNMMPLEDKAIVKKGMIPKKWKDMVINNMKILYIKKRYPELPDEDILILSIMIKVDIIKDWNRIFISELLRCGGN